MTKIYFGERSILEVEELPALTGTEKQVAWAESIRTDYVNQIRRIFDNLRHNAGVTDAAKIDAGAEAAHKNFSPFFDRRTDARYWIDNRNDDIRSLAKAG